MRRRTNDGAEIGRKREKRTCTPNNTNSVWSAETPAGHGGSESQFISGRNSEGKVSELGEDREVTPDLPSDNCSSRRLCFCVFLDQTPDAEHNRKLLQSIFRGRSMFRFVTIIPLEMWAIGNRYVSGCPTADVVQTSISLTSREARQSRRWVSR